MEITGEGKANERGITILTPAVKLSKKLRLVLR
jgi:hypothetical protein